MDLSGGGRLDVVDFSRPNPGFFKRTEDENWEPFERFEAWPDLDWSEPNLRFVDLTGDGLADILITEDGVYALYPSLGEQGYGDTLMVRTPWDEERGPKVVFGGRLADDVPRGHDGRWFGDAVRVRNGEVSYWPNTGYGQFGAKVTMDNAPRFTDQERFDPRRIRLADIDGTGAADLLYVGAGGVQVCFQSIGQRVVGGERDRGISDRGPHPVRCRRCWICWERGRRVWYGRRRCLHNRAR